MQVKDRWQHEIREVLRAFYDPDDPAYVGHREQWRADPVDAVRRVTAKKQFDWDDSQILVTGVAIGHRSTFVTIEMIDNLRGSEEMIWDSIDTMRPAYRSTLVMHCVTFGFGIALILTSVYAGFQGNDLLTLLFGASGLGSVLLVFFLNPLRGVQESVNNLIQLELIYTSYVKQVNYWRPYSVNPELDVKRTVLREIERCTARTVWLIQRYCKSRQPISHEEFNKH